ncbi:MAG: hypothetical protein LBD47_00310, partial [Treponema sp.]|nr:hypothetical protein [Treponema sp.]
MNKGEVYTVRTANLDGTGKENRNSASLQWETIDWCKVETFINKAQTRIAKAQAAEAEQPSAAGTGNRPAGDCL